MKRYHCLILILLSFWLANTCSASASGHSHWDSFFKNPNEGSFKSLEKVISKSAQNCRWGNTNNYYVVSLETGQQLFKLIANGNKYAFRTGLIISNCFDGGEIEDFYRNVGIFFEQRPYEFLEIINRKRIKKADYKKMLTMLPLDTVDNNTRRIDLFEKRISLLNGVNDKCLQKVKEVGISFLVIEVDILTHGLEN